MRSEEEIETLITLLYEKEALLKERELALQDQQEEFMSQHEELTAAVEALMDKNAYLSNTLTQLTQRNHELDQILYRASHDLRTPVSSMLGLLAIMQSEGINARQKVALDHLLQKTNQMEALLRSLSSLSIAFFHPLKGERCAVHELVQVAVKKVKMGPEANVNCQIDELQFSTDKNLLEIILLCLIKNAVDFSIPGSQNQITVQASVSASMLVVNVADHGEEIQPDIADRIFQMFYRGSVRSKGSGLGLYIVQRATERLKGHVRLERHEGWKQFVVTLPELSGHEQDVAQGS